jgi:putative cardiolipin synthase
MRRMGSPQQRLDIISPYFVPGAVGTEMLADMARRGVQVRVLTNSLASSDERVVHAGYLKRRMDLLRAGWVRAEAGAAKTLRSGPSGRARSRGCTPRSTPWTASASSSARSTSTSARRT